jgi:phosphoribosylanthranilate isomerase
MTRVKVCGITRYEDARLAVDLGAWAIGMILWPGSPRHIDQATAASIARRLPALVTTVGVFVNQDLDAVNGAVASCALGAVQLHGEEDAAYAAGVSARVIRATSLERCTPEWIDGLPPSTTLLLDASDPVKRGGTGRTIDWTRAAEVARRRPVILAGGLTPENVGEAIRRVRPAAIDVSSGVEATPGIKDAGRLRALFAALEQVEAGR